MVMFVEKDTELEVVGVGDEDSVLVLEKTFGVGGLVRVGWICEAVRDWVR